MLTYVLSKNGQPLMPTERCGKVRRLLKEHQATVVRRCPFTIRLLYDTTEVVQEVSLGVDAGSKHIGISASTPDRVLYEADVELRSDIVELLSARRAMRRSRRGRKTRYREPRFLNRVSRKHKGWLAPSVQQRVESHLRVVDKLTAILPISDITVEVASFDIQKIKDPSVQGTDYQQGSQMGFWNVREYVLFRDGHECQCCKGKSRDKILNVHHIESRKMGGDATNNLITLCETCHTGYHKGMVKLPDTIQRGMRFKDAVFMGIMRWAFYNELKVRHPNVHLTYGYITKNTRIEHHLPKEHYVDARCISGHPEAESDGTYYYQKKIRCHNRQLHKAKTLKGGIRKRNQAEYAIHGLRQYDKVVYQGQYYFVFGRRATGFMDFRTLSGEKVNKGSLSYKKVTFISPAEKYLTERRVVC